MFIFKKRSLLKLIIPKNFFPSKPSDSISYWSDNHSKPLSLVLHSTFSSSASYVPSGKSSKSLTAPFFTSKPSAKICAAASIKLIINHPFHMFYCYFFDCKSLAHIGQKLICLFIIRPLFLHITFPSFDTSLD